MKNFLKNRLRGRDFSSLYPTLIRLFVLVPMILAHFAGIPYVGNLTYFFLLVLLFLQVAVGLISFVALLDLSDNYARLDSMLRAHTLDYYQKDMPVNHVIDFIYQIPVLMLSVALGYWLVVILWLVDIIFLVINKSLTFSLIGLLEKRWTQKNSQQ